MRRICVIRQGRFPTDPRLSRQVAALTAAGHEVDVICVGWPEQARFQRVGAVTVYRIPIPRRRGGVLRYLFEFGAFHIAATLLASALHLRRRYGIVQVKSIPDTLVFTAVVPRLLGARIVLDLCECVPEFFAAKYRLRPRHPFVRLLMALEQSSIRFADSVITCTEQMRERFVARGAPGAKVTVVLDSANEEVFDADRYPAREGSTEQFILITHGTIEESFGIDTIIRAVSLLKDEIPGLELRVYGDGSFRPALESLAVQLGVASRVRITPGWVPVPELLSAIASADAGVVATKRNELRDLTHTNKMYELIAMRKPAIVARTRSVEAYFDDSCFQFFEPGDEHDLARAIRELHADPGLRPRLVRRATETCEPYRWVHESKRYLGVVERLIPDRQVLVGHRVVAAKGGDDA